MSRLSDVRYFYFFLIGFCIFVLTWTFWDDHGRFASFPAEPLEGERDARGRHHSYIGTNTSSARLDDKALWLTKQAQRQYILRQACRLHRNFGENHTITELIETRRKESFWCFVVDDRHRILYTFIAKVASSNWMRAFMVLTGKYKRIEEVPFHNVHLKTIKLDSFRGDGIKQRLNNYTNFIFVRHPFARVLSGYREKLEKPPEPQYQKVVGTQIIRRFRKNASAESLKKGTGVTFHEFVRYLVNTKRLDHHWRPIHDIALPCTVRFDYIGKLENMEEDAKYILQETHVDHLVRFAPTERKLVSHNETILNRYYSQIPRGDLVKLYKLYKPDFMLFGYQVPDSMNGTLGTV